MNLQQAPKVAEAILQMCGCPDLASFRALWAFISFFFFFKDVFLRNMFTHYDRAYIGQLCEKAGLMQWAWAF